MRLMMFLSLSMLVLMLERNDCPRFLLMVMTTTLTMLMMVFPQFSGDDEDADDDDDVHKVVQLCDDDFHTVLR